MATPRRQRIGFTILAVYFAAMTLVMSIAANWAAAAAFAVGALLTGYFSLTLYRQKS